MTAANARSEQTEARRYWRVALHSYKWHSSGRRTTIRSSVRAGYGSAWQGRSAPSFFSLRRVTTVQMDRRPPGSPGVQWLNRRDMSVRSDDSITLCQRAIQIVTELCLTGNVDREKCSDIFPLESSLPGKGHTGKYFSKVYYRFLFLINHFSFLSPTRLEATGEFSRLKTQLSHTTLTGLFLTGFTLPVIKRVRTCYCIK